MKIKTSELIDLTLDWAVAAASSTSAHQVRGTGPLHLWREVGLDPTPYRPSSDWSQGGPLIEREEIGVVRNAPCSRGREWEARPSITAKGAGGQWSYGPTPLIAAMRCYVASKLGPEVEIPDELVALMERPAEEPHQQQAQQRPRAR